MGLPLKGGRKAALVSEARDAQSQDSNPGHLTRASALPISADRHTIDVSAPGSIGVREPHQKS